MPASRKRAAKKPRKSAVAAPTAPETKGKYHSAIPEQARKLAQLGATDREMADFFEVDVRSFHRWKLTNAALVKALAVGKEVADNRVERTLYQSALGYEYDAQKPFVDKDGGEHVVDYREFVKPDTTAQIFWLKNRKPDEWRDRQEIAHTVTSADDLAAARRRALERSVVAEQSSAAA